MSPAGDTKFMWEDFLTFDELCAIPLEDEPIHLAMGICLPSRGQMDALVKAFQDRLAETLLGTVG